MPVNVKGLKHTLSGNNFFGAISPVQKFFNCRRIDSHLSGKKKATNFQKQKSSILVSLHAPPFLFFELQTPDSYLTWGAHTFWKHCVGTHVYV